MWKNKFVPTNPFSSKIRRDLRGVYRWPGWRASCPERKMWLRIEGKGILKYLTFDLVSPQISSTNFSKE